VISIAVTCSHLALKVQAQALAERLHLNYVDSPEMNSYSFLLNLSTQHLELISTHPEYGSPVFVDFLSGKTRHRLLYGGGRHQLLARAVGLHKKKYLTILDISAGLGQDAFQLASLGAEITMLERSPIVFALLQDAWHRAQQDEYIRQFQWRLLQTDAKTYLNSLTFDQFPQVIYFDPMFPSRKKSALVKKEMRLLRQIVGEDQDAPEILALALRIAKNRVVIKRPRTAPIVPGPAPDLQIKGQSSRFDIYLTYQESLKRGHI
jgi:16S rRNA (guanine1516-N2)-methyltransferase